MQAAVKTARPVWLLALCSQLFEHSHASTFGLACEEFRTALCEICDKYLGPDPAEQSCGALLSTLRLPELALARACAAGREPAWTEFLTRYRAFLYSAALAITRNDASGRELADSLYADLYGIRLRQEGTVGQERVSKLNSYTGRGSLEGWLRTVLAQQYVDQYRKQKRLVSLEEEAEAGTQFEAPIQQNTIPSDPRLVAATDAALASLEAEERLILASYFLDERNLADIARSLRVHESTISRKLERAVKSLRKRILKDLVKAGMSNRAAEEALDLDVRDLAINVRQRLRPPPDKAAVE